MPPRRRPNDHLIDLCFVIDATGSMGPYIEAAADSVNDMAKKIRDEIQKKDKTAPTTNLKVAVVAFRDFNSPGEDDPSFKSKAYKIITKFTEKMDEVENKLGELGATGGGDGPEAVATGIKAAITQLDWRDPLKEKKPVDKIIILITDAPPHGYNPRDLDDTGADPVKCFEIRDDLIQEKISIFVLKCLPEMNEYAPLGASYYDDYLTKTKKKGTDGKYLPNGASVALADAELLSNAVVGLTVEGRRLKDAIKTYITDKKKLKTTGKFVLPQMHSYLSFIATGVNDGEDKTIRTTDDAVRGVKKLLQGTEFPSLKNSIYTKPFSLADQRNAALWDRVASGEQVDLEREVEPVDHGNVDDQTLDYEYGPINDYQVARLAAMYTDALEGDADDDDADDNNEEEEEEQNEAEDDGEDKGDGGADDDGPTMPTAEDDMASYWEKRAAYEAK